MDTRGLKGAENHSRGLSDSGTSRGRHGGDGTCGCNGESGGDEAKGKLVGRYAKVNVCCVNMNLRGFKIVCLQRNAGLSTSDDDCDIGHEQLRN